ncbi:MAG: carbon-nitrogen hydrolase family protein, partial [Firmicutes bacterium]|nr:carbon-nitrogen hydrolase family protein [Bacillota bacterium]
MKIAMIQMEVVYNKEQNIAHALELIDRACAEEKPDFVVLPEMFCCPYSNKYFREYGEELNGPAQKALSEAAKRHGIYLIGGSLPELEEDRVYNTSFVYDREGKQIARHRKAHLFDIDVPGGQRFFESEVLTPGQETTTFETEFGLMGLCICFDFRSQEIAKTMGDRGAKVLFVPAAFNMTTGPAHWEILFRSRAIDNQLFTLATAPARDENGEYVS